LEAFIVLEVVVVCVETLDFFVELVGWGVAEVGDEFVAWVAEEEADDEVYECSEGGDAEEYGDV